MENQVTHIEKQDLPNPFALSARQEVMPAPKTITVIARPVQPTSIVSGAIPIPIHDQRREIEALPTQSRQSESRTQQRRQIMTQPVQLQNADPQSAFDVGAQLGEAIDSFFSNAFDGFSLIGGMMDSLFTSLGSAFSFSAPARRQQKISQPMPMIRYAVPSKLGVIVFSRIEAEVYGSVAVGYKDDHFIFTVPIRMYKLCEATLKAMRVPFDRLDR